MVSQLFLITMKGKNKLLKIKQKQNRETVKILGKKGQKGFAQRKRNLQLMFPMLTTGAIHFQPNFCFDQLSVSHSAFFQIVWTKWLICSTSIWPIVFWLNDMSINNTSIMNGYYLFRFEHVCPSPASELVVIHSPNSS